MAPGEVGRYPRSLSGPMPGIITLTSDFGSRDAYVAAMKGVILSLHPEARIVDVTHEVRPQKIEQAVFIAAGAWPYFPDGCVHVAVVDPRVGTERRAIALVGPAAIFVGPDNGVLSAALPAAVREGAVAGGGSVALPEGFAAYVIENVSFLRHPVSRTFHGRDIFAPVSAHLARGVSPEELGARVGEIVALPPFRAERLANGSLRARIIHLDRFGNLITDLSPDQVASSRIEARVRGQNVDGLYGSYAEGRGLMALVGSSGFVEIARREGSAAEELSADIGEEVLVTVIRGRR